MADSKKATGGNRFSVYAGLGDSPEISWSTVASTLSEDLTSMRETKMKERAAIEKATNEQMEALNKLQDVNSRSLGRVVLEGSSQSKEELRLRMDLVRKGLLKPADYKLFMQEQKSGYSNFSNIVKTYDQWHTKAMEKINAGTATDAEIFVLKQIESFGNLNNKKIYTNPANGQIQVVTMEEDEDGKFTKMPSAKDSPNSFNNPGSMLDLMSYDGGVKKELRDEAKKITDSIATIITSSVSNGSVTKTSDFRKIFDNPESLKKYGITDGDITTFDQWLDSQVDTLTATDADMAQILSQRGYQYDDKDAPNYIELYIKGGQVVYKLTPEQKAKARQIAKNEINMQIDSEITKTPGFDPNRDKKDDRSYNNKIAKGTKIVDSLNSVYSGGQEEVDGALANLFAEAGLRYENFREDGDNFYLRYLKQGADGSMIREEQKIPKGSNKEEFMQNAYQFFNLGGEIDYDTARAKANVGERGYAEVDVDEKGNPIYYKSTKDDKGNVTYLDKAGNPTTNRKDFVIMPAPENLTQAQIDAGEIQKEQEGNTRKITRQRGTQTEAPQEQRDAILSSSTVGSGSNAKLLSSTYEEAVKDITSNYAIGSGDGSEAQISILVSGIKKAFNLAGEARNSLSKVQEIQVTKSGKIITITAPGLKNPVTITSTKDGTLMGKVDDAVNKVLTAILPAQKGGYEGLDYGNK